MGKIKVLLVDEDNVAIKERKELLKNVGYDCYTFVDYLSALNSIPFIHPKVIVIKLSSQVNNLWHLLARINQKYKNILSIVLSEQNSVEIAVEAMKKGAFDFINYPFSNDRLLKSIEQAKYQILSYNLFGDKFDDDDVVEFYGMVGKCSEMIQIFKKVIKIAKTNSNVLILGESGTGKELLARSIHLNSNRKNHQFIPVACNALPKTLLESELFGYEKGAFTGAQNLKIGLIELANNGTIFFDEVTEIDLDVQPKLLRFLQDRKIRRLGGLKEIEVNTRIIAASNKDPLDMIKIGAFREDLYYRLDVIKFELPPLRKRTEDIPALINYFIKKINKEVENKVENIDRKVVEILSEYNWPGNIRQLENVIEHSIAIAEDNEIHIDQLPPYLQDKNANFQPKIMDNPNFKAMKKQHIEKFERHFIYRLLKKYNGNISQAAKEAGINRRTIYRMIDEYNISI